MNHHATVDACDGKVSAVNKINWRGAPRIFGCRDAIPFISLDFEKRGCIL